MEELQLINIGRRKLFDILRANHLLIQPKRSCHINPIFYQRFRKHQTQIIRLDIKRPEQVWVFNIIYIGKEKSLLSWDCNRYLI